MLLPRKQLLPLWGLVRAPSITPVHSRRAQTPPVAHRSTLQRKKAIDKTPTCCRREKVLEVAGRAKDQKSRAKQLARASAQDHLDHKHL